MARKKTGKQGEPEQVVSAKRVLSGLLRNQRDCGIGMYLLLLELAGTGGPLSGLALVRRLKAVGMVNPRQELTRGQVQRWIRAVDEVDGRKVERSWELTEAGRAVVAGVMRRTGLRVEYENEALARERAAGEAVRDASEQMFMDFD